ncbi:MAG: DNA polymerase Y family protein [Alphaproteobacteria bacterium]
MVSLWFPRFATDRCQRSLKQQMQGQSRNAARPDPVSEPVLVMTMPEGGAIRLSAVTLAAQKAGLSPGQTLADARALLPDVAVHDADPDGDSATLERIAAWCTRYTPWTAPSGLETGGAAGIWLDVSGCAHLFGGEAAMLEDMTKRLATIGYTARAGLADTVGAAWAAARFGKPGKARCVIFPEGGHAARLAPFPNAALRLPSDILDGLERLGLRNVGDLAALPRAGLARRFGELPARRLDQALGRVDEPISPRAPAPVWRLRTAFAEALGREEHIAAAARNLLEALCNRLARAERGARRLELCLYRVGGRVDTIMAGTSRASHDPDHLMRLLGEQLERLPEPPTSAPDPLSAAAEAMVETLTLAAVVTEPLRAAQTRLVGGRDSDPAALERLVDRLAGRLGPDNVMRFRARETHLPERVQEGASALTSPSAAADGNWQTPQPRPPRLLARPEEVEAMAPVPDDPPVLFRWRGHTHRITRAEGPERIEPEWWRQPETGGNTNVLDRDTRDYYRVEDTDGRRFWLYREGLYDRISADTPPRWFLHGLFG